MGLNYPLAGSMSPEEDGRNTGCRSRVPSGEALVAPHNGIPCRADTATPQTANSLRQVLLSNHRRTLTDLIETAAMRPHPT